eukprot:GEMP01019848.1.p1 GENE.GEMP01019848.1~~GEMP01019848.1.p1  ORF type:complete len:281 (+),score=51.75 GEMP01019848.1:259-1101(+)
MILHHPAATCASRRPPTLDVADLPEWEIAVVTPGGAKTTLRHSFVLTSEDRIRRMLIVLCCAVAIGLSVMTLVTPWWKSDRKSLWAMMQSEVAGVLVVISIICTLCASCCAAYSLTWENKTQRAMNTIGALSVAIVFALGAVASSPQAHGSSFLSKKTGPVSPFGPAPLCLMLALVVQSLAFICAVTVLLRWMREDASHGVSSLQVVVRHKNSDEDISSEEECTLATDCDPVAQHPLLYQETHANSLCSSIKRGSARMKRKTTLPTSSSIGFQRHSVMQL